VSDVLTTGLTRWSHPTSDTDVYSKGVYAWQPGAIDEKLSDGAIIHALRQRLKYVHTTPVEALAQCVKDPNVAKNPNAFGEHGVDAAVLVAFAAQVLYNLSEARASSLLLNASGSAKTPMISVPKFLGLFSSDGGVLGGDAPKLKKIEPNKNVEKLTHREVKLLMTMRDYLFEQHSEMKNMFRRCDPDGSGAVSIEEFLNAMKRAGVPVGHGLDRQKDSSISEDEAANIVGFFDRDGDGFLKYHEFMNMLQSTKNSVLTKKVLTQR